MSRSHAMQPSDIRQEDVRERQWCLACGTVTRDNLCDCNRWPDGDEMKREPNFVNYADELHKQLRAALSAQTGEPVAWRWRHADSKHWIYDPSPEWREDFKDDPAVVFEPLYASPPPQPDTMPSPLSRVCDCVGPAEADPQPCRCEKSDDRFWQGYNAGLKAPRHAPGQPPSPLSTGEVDLKAVLRKHFYTGEPGDLDAIESAAIELSTGVAALSQPPATEQISERIKVPLPAGIDDTPSIRAKMQSSLLEATAKGVRNLAQGDEKSSTLDTARGAKEQIRREVIEPDFDGWPIEALEEVERLRTQVETLKKALHYIAEVDWRWEGGGSDVRLRGNYSKVAAHALGLPANLSPGWPTSAKAAEGPPTDHSAKQAALAATEQER